PRDNLAADRGWGARVKRLRHTCRIVHYGADRRGNGAAHFVGSWHAVIERQAGRDFLALRVVRPAGSQIPGIRHHAPVVRPVLWVVVVSAVLLAQVMP